MSRTPMGHAATDVGFRTRPTGIRTAKAPLHPTKVFPPDGTHGSSGGNTLSQRARRKNEGAKEHGEAVSG